MGTSASKRTILDLSNSRTPIPPLTISSNLLSNFKRQPETETLHLLVELMEQKNELSYKSAETRISIKPQAT